MSIEKERCIDFGVSEGGHDICLDKDASDFGDTLCLLEG